MAGQVKEPDLSAGGSDGQHPSRDTNMKQSKPTSLFTLVEWWIFRLTGLALLVLLAYKLLRAELSGL